MTTETTPITLTFHVTNKELENLLRRALGEDRTVTMTTAAPAPADTEDNEPVNATPPATDKNGVPWSAEHHAKTKSLNVDGTWRRIRGGDAAVIDAYEAQFKTSASAIAAATAAALANPASAAPVVTTAPAAEMPNISTAAATFPGFPAPTAAEALPEPISYETLMAKLNEVAPKVPQLMQMFSEIYTKVGITDPNSMQTNETHRRGVFDALCRIEKGEAI